MTAAAAGYHLPGSGPQHQRWWALAASIVFHCTAAAVLLANWMASPPPAPAVSTLQTRLVALPPPALEVAPRPEAPKHAEQRREPKPEPRPEPPPREAPKKADVAMERVEPAPEAEQERAPAEPRTQAQQPAPDADTESVDEAPVNSVPEQVAFSDIESSYRPLVKQPPSYPARALDRGIEGDCTIRYTVNREGRVERPEAEKDCHPLFVQPSLAAARNFRYSPHQVEGQPVAVVGVRNTFHYRLRK